MPEHLQPPALDPISNVDDAGERLRILARSPHPYHRRNFELLEPSDTLDYRRASSGAAHEVANNTSSFTKESTPASDSGTEADDEHFLKRLPAPKTRRHKGLRGQNEPLSGSSTPLMSPAWPHEEGRTASHRPRRESFGRGKCLDGERSRRRRKELVRRLTELALLASLGYCVRANPQVQPFLLLWRRGRSPLPCVPPLMPVADCPQKLPRNLY